MKEKNIFTYLKEFGNYTFKEKQINEVDNLIMARISYFPLELIIDYKSKVTIKETYNLFVKKKLNKKDFLLYNDYLLLEKLSTSKRYENIVLKRFINKYNIEKEIQFAVISILLPNNYIYISFRGTDDSITGWKEDFNLCFLKDIPSQIEALKYLNGAVYFNKKIIVGGHSKGGNLAIYASWNSNYFVRNKIVNIYNYDGPGFLDDIINNDKYLKIDSKIKTYIPKSSVIGRLLNHGNNYKVIKSKACYLIQHDIYTWTILGNDFEYLNGQDKKTININKKINDWILSLTITERKRIINILYNIFIEAKITNFKNLINPNNYSDILNIINSYNNISKEDKKYILTIIKYLFLS